MLYLLVVINKSKTSPPGRVLFTHSFLFSYLGIRESVEPI